MQLKFTGKNFNSEELGLPTTYHFNFRTRHAELPYSNFFALNKKQSALEEEIRDRKIST
ncbi:MULTISPECIES: hypothetical protein [unclassified Wolbachia]|uniref:hypothetical protein n=1 Tax=unclassified Wolbachia TaxID=2640676 RepID=UPI000ABEBCC9|nr:hypothetical protein [Wolbachia endosymbiont of Laodelphax striatellus]